MTTDQTSVPSGELSEQEAQTAATQVAMRAGLRTLVECCNVVDERIGHAREVELGMMAGAGVVPGPFSRADDIGLDVALQAIEWARTEWGDAFTPPVLLRRLVAQGRLGKKSGQGFFAYPQPDEGEQTETVVLETRGKVAIAWLSKPPVNPLGPQMFADLMTTWEKVEANSKIKVLVIASSSNVVYSAGADLKAFAQLDVDGSADLVSAAHKVMRAFERGKTVTIAAVNGAAL
ncbi:MAG: hypothetical protein JHC87_08465, partial [Thermoleophilaceae bacterium]|nr:hypothetical protein [Thermoleophilaceae bacterium]